MAGIFLEIGLIFILSTVAAYFFRLLKQPIMPAYIIVGILIGPVFGLLKDLESMWTLAEIGIAFLLFIVGLELDLKKLRDLGKVVVIGSLAHMVVLFLAGHVISLLLGFESLTAVYIGLILAFSSTLVIVKLLSDKNELDTLHGRILVGILLMQDLVAIISLSVLKDLDHFSFFPFVESILIGLLLVFLAYLLGKFVFPRIFSFAAKQQELLFLLSLSVCFLFSLIFSLAGFSIAIGSFIAGITLANLPYNTEIIGKVKSLRDFFSVLFFTAIGAELVITDFSSLILPLIIFVLFTTVLLPFVTMVLLSFFGFKTRTGFSVAMSLAQISEFSLIIVSQGLALGHVDQSVLSLTILLTLVTMTLSSYLINYESLLYSKVGVYFKFLEKLNRNQKELSLINPVKAHDYVLVGLDRIGYSIFRKLRSLNKDVVIVDFNPDIIKRLISENVPCIYGDISDPEVVEKLRLKDVKMVISTIPDFQGTLFLLKKVKEENPSARIIVTNYLVEDALALYDAGADYVIVPHYLGGEHVSVMLEEVSDDLDKLIMTKLSHIKELKHRRSLHPNHR